MNPETGQIHPPEEVAAMPRAERRNLVSIPASSLAEVLAMDREKRKAWAATEKKQLLAKRTKAKAARRARRAGR